jgi:hypothetical protein
MSIYDADAFFDSEFVETVIYRPYKAVPEDIVPVTIDDAVVIWKDARQASVRGADTQQMLFEFEVMIRKSYVATVTEKKDKIIVKDKKGANKTVLVSEIIYSDPESWIFGCI